MMELIKVSETIGFSYRNDPCTYQIGRDFSVGLGQRVCIRGGSGTGKSTMLTLLAGLRRFDVGEIVYKFDTSRHAEFVVTARDWNVGPPLWKHIGFSFQRPELVNSLTVRQNLALTQGSAADKVGERLFSATGEWKGLRDRCATEGGLSGGQKLRLGLGRAFGVGQQLVIVDEPTAALDVDNRKMVAEFVKERSDKVGLLVVAHDPEFVASLDVTMTYEVAQIDDAGQKTRRLERVS